MPVACQGDIGKCYQAKLVRGWLRTTIQHFQDNKENEKNETQASLSGISILSAPYTTMSYAILSFITGLAIYQGLCVDQSARHRRREE